MPGNELVLSIANMGCGDSRIKTPEGELELRSKEGKLGWEDYQARRAIETLALVSRKGRINAKAWADAVSTLKLKAQDDRHPGALESYYTAFKEGQEDYSTKLLQLLALLLCWERGNAKARLIFELYDHNYSLTLSRDTVEELLRDLLHVAIELQANLVGVEEAKEYLKWLAAWQSHFLADTLERIMGGNAVISRESFEEQLGKEPLTNYLSAGPLRLAVYSSLKSSQQTS